MVIFQVTLKVNAEQVEAFKAACAENGQHTTAEPGCLRFEVYQDSSNPVIFTLFEIYESNEAQQAHYQTAHFQAWNDATQGMILDSGVRTLQLVYADNME